MRCARARADSVTGFLMQSKENMAGEGYELA